MGAKAFNEQWQQTRREFAADIEAIDEAARRVEMSEFFDAFAGFSDDGPARPGAERAEGHVADAAAAGPLALQRAFADSRARRRMLWAACAVAIGRIEESLDDEVRRILALPPRQASAASASMAAELDREAAEAEAALGGQSAVEDGSDAEEGLWRCKQRLLAMRERARFLASANPAAAAGKPKVWKFGRPRPLERPEEK